MARLIPKRNFLNNICRNAVVAKSNMKNVSCRIGRDSEGKRLLLWFQVNRWRCIFYKTVVHRERSSGFYKNAFPDTAATAQKYIVQGQSGTCLHHNGLALVHHNMRKGVIECHCFIHYPIAFYYVNRRAARVVNRCPLFFPGLLPGFPPSLFRHIKQEGIPFAHFQLLFPNSLRQSVRDVEMDFVMLRTGKICCKRKHGLYCPSGICPDDPFKTMVCAFLPLRFFCRRCAFGQATANTPFFGCFAVVGKHQSSPPLATHGIGAGVGI